MPSAAARRLRRARFEFQTREEAASIAEYVATLLPRAVPAEFVLMELMVNAIEHGNLEIKCAKPELVRCGTLEAEVTRRLADPRYHDRIAWLEVERDGQQVTFSIGDGGPGFAWQEIAMPVNGTPCGRGLALVRAMAAGQLGFNDAGNIVTVRVQW